MVPAMAAVGIGPLSWVGDANNLPDPATNFGRVTYNYQIAQTEVTNHAYTAFLNSVAQTDTNALYNPAMGSDVRGGITRTGASGSYVYTVKTGMDFMPVNYVSFFDAARFTNWIQNGQPIGVQDATTTEDGAYFLTVTDAYRQVAAQIWVPTEDEWYKAAYYTGSGNTYNLYATNSNTAPTVATDNVYGVISNPGANVANYQSGADWTGAPGTVTLGASAASTSPYGTYDQSGNVSEWTETTRGLAHIVRGGAFEDSAGYVSTSVALEILTGEEFDHLGFRLAIPEPSSFVMTLLAGGLLLRRRRL